MRVAYFFCVLPEPADGALPPAWAFYQPLTGHWLTGLATTEPGAPAAGAALPAAPAGEAAGFDVLAQQQAIYDELLGSTDWATPRRPQPDRQPRSARALTRELAGWSLPQPTSRPPRRA